MPTTFSGCFGLRGDVGDGNGRGVRGEDGARLLAIASNSREHLALDVDVLDDGFDDEIAALEAAPVGRGGDARQLALHLAAGHAAAVDFLLPDFRGRLHAAGDRLPVDVAHAHRGVGLVGDELGDAAAHDARAEDAGVADFDRRRGDALLLRLLHHEEEADEVLRDFACGPTISGTTSSTSRARPRSTPADMPYSMTSMALSGAGIVAVRLRQHRFARLAEDDAARQRIAFDVELRAVRCRGASASVENCLAMSSRIGGGNDFVDETHSLGALPVERLAVEDDVERGGKPDEARQLRRAAPRREDAELRLRQSDLRLRAVGHDAVVAA